MTAVTILFHFNHSVIQGVLGQRLSWNFMNAVVPQQTESPPSLCGFYVLGNVITHWKTTDSYWQKQKGNLLTAKQMRQFTSRQLDAWIRDAQSGMG